MTVPLPSGETSTTLLQRFAEERNEAAFRSLVDQYLPLVMAAALRRTGGQRALAEEAAQNAFADLAKRAATLRDGERLGGWLHQRTIRAASDLMKSDHRRQAREAEAARRASLHQSPVHATLDLTIHLDEALARLRPADRDALVLRYLEGRSLASVGLALGLSEDASQKRVARALEKLRRLLSHRGTAILAPAVLAALTTSRTQAATGILTPALKTTLTHTALAAKLSPLATLGHFLVGGAPRFATGLTLAAAVWVWPLIAQHRTNAAALAHSKALTTSATTPAKAIPTPPAFPVLVRAPEGSSIEEITKRLTALCEGPFSALAKLHAQELLDRVPLGQEATILKAMHRQLTRDGRLNDERLWIGPGSLGQTWAKQDPVNTLSFLSKLMDRVQQDGDWQAWIDRSNWSSVISEATTNFAQNDPAAYLDWKESDILRHLKNQRRLDWGNQGLSTAGALAPEKAIRFYIRLENAIPESIHYSGHYEVLHNIKDWPLLLTFFGRTGEISRLSRRTQLKQTLISKMASLDWAATHAMVDAMQGGERARFSPSVAFPPDPTDLTPYADWWASVQTSPTANPLEICYSWFLRGDTPGMMRWLEKQQSSTAVTGILISIAGNSSSRLVNVPHQQKQTTKSLNEILSLLEARDPALFSAQPDPGSLGRLLEELEQKTLPPETTRTISRLKMLLPKP